MSKFGCLMLTTILSTEPPKVGIVARRMTDGPMASAAPEEPATASVERRPVDRPGAAPQARRWAVFVVVSSSLLMISLDQTAIATALSAVQADLGAGIEWTGWTITVYSVGQILALPLGGRLGDQFGKRRVFLVAIGVFAVASVVCAVTVAISQLIVCRFVQGVAGGMLLPAGMGIVAHVFGRDRDRALALFTSVFPVGAVLGPLLGGVVVTAWSWRGIFLINLPLVLVLLVSGFFLVREPPRRQPERVDVRGIVLLLIVLLGAMLTITRVGALSAGVWGAIGVGASGIVAVVSGWAFVRHARRHPDPVVPIHLLVGGGLGSMNVLNVAFGAAAIGFSALAPLYAQSRYGIVPLAAGALLTVRAMGMIGSSGVAVALLRRAGHRPLLLAGMGGIVVGLVLTAVPPPGVAPELWLAVAAAVTGLGMGLAAPASNNAGMHLVPGEVSAVSGLRIMFRQFGAIIAVSVTTAASAASANPGLATSFAFGGLAVAVVVATAVAARIPNQRGRW